MIKTLDDFRHELDRLLTAAIANDLDIAELVSELKLQAETLGGAVGSEADTKSRSGA